MAYRDILGVVLDVKADESVIAATAQLAAQSEGRGSILLLAGEPEPYFAAEPVGVGGVWGQVLDEVAKRFKEEEKALRARLQQEERDITPRSLLILSSLLAERTALEARHADITVIGRPVDAERKAIFESVLFGSGRPVLIVPPDWRPQLIARHVAVAWNAKREASRALADARPLMEAADKVSIITLDAKPGLFGHGEAPGADIAAHLARTGVKVGVVNADGLGRSDASALLEEAGAIGADLLVLGGYGHARVLQMAFGGVTREIVQSAHLPILMSH